MTRRITHSCRLLVLCLFCAVLSLGACETVPSIGVDCSNTLNATSFGFSLTVPPSYSCIDVAPNDALLLSVRYREADTNYICSIIVGPDSGEDIAADTDTANVDELDGSTNAHDVSFRRFKLEATDVDAVGYVGLATLPSGNLLSVSMGFTEDNAAMLSDLDAILATVQFAEN